MAANRNDFSLRNEGEIDSAVLLSDPTISLYSLDVDAGEALFVSTPPDLDLQAAPFYYQVQFACAESLYTVDLDEFVELAEQIPAPRALVPVHNIGRCGSTLLSRVFARHPAAVSYSEPDFFTMIAFQRTVNDPRDPLWSSLLRAGMRFTFRGLPSNANTGVVKFRSGCLNLLDLFLAEFPSAAHLFLFRDCFSWVESLVNLTGCHQDQSVLPRDKFGDYFRYFNGRGFDQCLLPYDRLPDRLTCVERLTVSWLIYRDIVDANRASLPDDALVFAYDDLIADSRSCVERILRRAGLPLDDLPNCLDAMHRDSQEGTAFARIAPDSPTRYRLRREDREQIDAILALHPGKPDGLRFLPVFPEPVE